MLKGDFAVPKGEFHTEVFGAFGVWDKLKSVIAFIQWNRINAWLKTQPEDIQAELCPYVQQQLHNLK